MEYVYVQLADLAKTVLCLPANSNASMDPVAKENVNVKQATQEINAREKNVLTIVMIMESAITRNMNAFVILATLAKTVPY